MSQAPPATLHIVRVERDLINDTGLYEVAYSQNGAGEHQPQIRQFLGEQPLMQFLERDLGKHANEARHIVDRVREGQRVHVPVDWSGLDVTRFGLGTPRKAA